MMKNKKVLPYIAGTIMIVLFGMGLWNMNSTDQGKVGQQAKTEHVDLKTGKQIVLNGTAEIAQVAKGASVAVGVPTRITLLADAKGGEITDYDLLIKYDKTAFKIGGVQSLLPDFTTVPYIDEENAVVSITGFQSAAAKSGTVLSDTAVAELTVTPIKSGTFTFQTVDKSGRATSKYMKKDGSIMYPKGSMITVTVSQ